MPVWLCYTPPGFSIKTGLFRRVTASLLTRSNSLKGTLLQGYLSVVVYLGFIIAFAVVSLGMVDEPLAFLDQSKTRPAKAALDEIMEAFR